MFVANVTPAFNVPMIAEKRKHVALLSLTEETERHIAHMHDAPVAAIVDAGIIDRLARMHGEALQAALTETSGEARQRPVEQWKAGPVQALKDFKFAEEESD